MIHDSTIVISISEKVRNTKSIGILYNENFIRNVLGKKILKIGAMVLSSLIVSIYYNMINAWAFHYLFSSMSASLPWLNCDNKWNDPDRK
jgi:SNF family Na+-dependent transporter